MSGLYDGVNQIWVLRTRSGLDLHGEKTDVEMIGHLARCAASRGDDWREAIAGARAAIDRVEADCVRDDLRDQALDIRREVADALWARWHEEWLSLGRQMAKRGGETLTIDHASTRAAYAARCAGALKAIYDETFDALEDDLNDRIEAALYAEGLEFEVETLE